MATSIIEATIEELQQALKSGQTNSVELTAKHLLRIAKYDRRDLYLNSTPIINLNAFDEAQASDDLRAAGQIRSDLEGIPCTIKDSYKIKGMTVASGSPAFQNLVATDDSFVVSQIKSGGGVILGKTNMPPMAAGGMQRGVYGRAESPYNADYLTAAFASGSSNGSATATAASFGLFGMGEETISSGRSPASYNGLVAYTGSRGMISIRGNWPLFPNCDTVVPHTRTVKDMFSLLDVLVAHDDQKHCDFWREQPFVPLPDPEDVRPTSFLELCDKEALKGKVLGVPKMYIGGDDPAALPVALRPSVKELWEKARKTLESLGAIVVETDFPIVTNLEKPPSGEKPTTPYFTPAHKNEIDMVQMMAYTWDDFLVANNDKSCVTTLANVDPAEIFPPPPGALPDRYGPDDPLVKCSALVDAVKGGRVKTFDVPGLGPKLQRIEETRKVDFEAWLDANQLDAVVFPCQGDVGKADADKNEESARDAWRNGVLYSNGNCAIRQFGIPTFSVPMGNMSDIGMPVNLTFAAKAYHDPEILRYGYAFETAHQGRVVPPRTPALPTDKLESGAGVASGGKPPVLDVTAKKTAEGKIELTGSASGDLASLTIYVDGVEAASIDTTERSWTALVDAQPHEEAKVDGKKVPDIALAMIVVLATGKSGRSTGKLLFA
ncbi:Glutamyl-tRNA(Gln) amidotransferase subunit A [Pseudocercospora fuligena]|uniref:Glutamyl-tRNA(Gln) amidotransferase subunit A n=1 Tax=Pseudocercospora fuligena TaxID=685502 RepID=A0A8H6VG95_9PEZI|nr:Glutamyl-tRNA(Gln) amidotransferase subunit A [Pseudocercospora fuligena]